MRKFVLLLALLSTAAIGAAPVATLVDSSIIDAGFGRAAGPPLASAIAYSRDQALRSGTRPIPADIRKSLESHFPAKLLEQVRWTVSGRRVSIDTLVTGVRDDEHAIALGRVVVFSEPKLASVKKLWVHELLHVQQYEKLGLDGFAARYAANWEQLEAEADAGTEEIMRKVRRQSGSAKPT